MGKGSKDLTRLIYSEPEPKIQISVNERFVTRTERGIYVEPPIQIPPGVPECDVVLKGNNRFWYIEPGLFLFGIGGMLVSAVMLIRYYINHSIFN